MNRQPESTSSLNRARHIVTLSGALLAAFAMRIYRIGDQNVWCDEGLAI